jgi:dipeptidase E
MRLLLLSNSTNPGEPYLAWPRAHLAEFLGAAPLRIAFVPYAGVRVTWDEYTSRVADALGALGGHEVTGVHAADDPARAVASADAVAVGGGNTFRLLERLHATGLVGAIRDRVRAGAPYVGWSAGSNVACPTIRTTNDMPIVEPPTLGALGLVPFQINAHYTEARLPNHGGETRVERLLEFVELDRDATVLGLPEGTALRVEGARVTLLGGAPAVRIRYGREPEPLAPGAIEEALGGPG